MVEMCGIEPQSCFNLFKSLQTLSNIAILVILLKMCIIISNQKKTYFTKDGEDMLLYQGVLAFELFTNEKANNMVIEAMRRGLKGE